MRLQHKFLSSILAVSLLPLFLLGFLFYSNYSRDLTSSSREHLHSVASIQQSRIAAIMSQNRERLALVASRTQLRLSLDRFLTTGDEAARGRMVRILRDAARSLPDLRTITVYDLAGTAVASTDTALHGTPHFDLEILRASLGSPVVDRMYRGAEGEPRLRLCGPLLLDGRTIGAMVIQAEVQDLVASLSDYAGLGDSGETLLLRPDPEQSGWQFLAATRFAPDAALRHCVFGGAVDIPADGPGGALGVTIDYRKVPVEAVAHRFRDTDWVVLVKMDRREIQAGLRSTARWAIILAGVMTLLVGALAIWLARGLSAPLVALADAAGQYAEGNFELMVNVNTRDELATLANGFNAMGGETAQAQGRLKEQIERLELEIQRRHLVEKEKEKLIGDLQQALSEIKTLEGIIPICASCKKIRDDQGYWKQLETYLLDHSQARFSHGICPDCYALADRELQERENGKE